MRKAEQVHFQGSGQEEEMERNRHHHCKHCHHHHWNSDCDCCNGHKEIEELVGDEKEQLKLEALIQIVLLSQC